ncbi:MAG: hypothetical protein PUD15_01145 [Prevotella sp.]|nr:hypothetical protein [Prevotella sp.]
MIIFDNKIFYDDSSEEGYREMRESGKTGNEVNGMLIGMANTVSDTTPSIRAPKSGDVGIIRMAGFIDGHVYDAELQFPNRIVMKYDIPFRHDKTYHYPYGLEDRVVMDNRITGILNTLEKRLVKAGMENCEATAYGFGEGNTHTMVVLNFYCKSWRDLSKYKIADFGQGGRWLLQEK